MAIELCDERRKLLDADGHLLIRGGAGSGKTTIALLKASSDLNRGLLDRDGKVLFLSFARATVARVAEQAAAIVKPELAKRIEINTYHGFAWSILRSHAYLLCERKGVSILLPAQARSHLAGLSNEQRLARQVELFKTNGLISFDLFPGLVADLLEQVPLLARSYASAYPLIVVDEFQDTNAEEWRMIKLLGAHSRTIALGDPKQRIYEFKGADAKRFDEFIGDFNPREFDFKTENRRSSGSQIADFANDLTSGAFTMPVYAGVTISTYGGRSLVPLKREILKTVGRVKRAGKDWSVAVLVPSNTLAASIFEFMNVAAFGLPKYPVDILVSAEGPMLAANVIALLLEPPNEESCEAALLEALAAFELGRSENASAGAMKNALAYRALAEKTRMENAALEKRVIGKGVKSLVEQSRALRFSGDPITDWRAVRRLFDESSREELKIVGKEARHMRLLRKSAQIEGRLADAWRTEGCYRDARALLRDAIVEDQFAATTRPWTGVTVMTIHKAKGKEFDEVIVYEGAYHRYLARSDAEGQRSARFNLHVAATRARRAVNIMTPALDRCPLLPP